MCAGGVPEPSITHPADAVKAAVAMQEYVKSQVGKAWQLRVGVHTGPVTAGVVGKHKFAFDIWGDAVNLAARMEQSGVAGSINISQNTYELVRGHFQCQHRGKVKAKNKGEIDMYLVLG
jgi:class 3 adenylate cyclase